MDGAPIVLFGAFDRHNLGDILLGRAAALATAPRSCLFAGLKGADLSPWGGFPVESLEEVAADWRRRFGAAPLDLVHVGGEILDTDAWEAAVMLLDPVEAPAVIARLDADPVGRMDWAASFLGHHRPAPYVLGPGDLNLPGRREFRAVGGVGLGRRDEAFRAAIARALTGADALSVRDHRTRAALMALGLEAEPAPDPVTALGPWLKERVGERRPGDYLAVQCAATFGDHRSLDLLAGALAALGRPVLIFRAGAAPWHDDLDVCRALAERLPVPASILDSLHVADICAALAGARACLASSLHALLVAGVFGVPALGLERRPGEGEKLRAYSETWGGFALAHLEELAVRARPFRTCPSFFEPDAPEESFRKNRI